MPNDVTASLPEQAPGLRFTPSTLRLQPALVVIEAAASPPEVEWSVGAVSEQCGIPTATLRSWDRRYTENDIRRVQMVVQLVDRGVPTQTAARVALAMDQQRLEREVAQA